MSTVDTPKHARLHAARALVSENPVLVAVAGIGFFVSFQTIASVARAQHMHGWPVLYPLLIDSGIVGFIIEARKAIDDDRSDLAPRLLAWLFAGFTVYVNAHGSSARDWVGVALHVAAPVMWVAFLELTRWRKLRHRRAERGDTIPLARWLLAPLRTSGMRKRMVLHDVRSYSEAVAREEARLLAIDLTAATFGRKWKRDAPRLLVHHLREGTLPSAVAQACTYRSSDLPEKVDQWVSDAAVQRGKAAARARQALASEQPDVTPQPPRQAATRKRVSDREAKRLKVRRLLTDSPGMPRAEVARRAGVSEATVDRVKREMPRTLHPVREA